MLKRIYALFILTAFCLYIFGAGVLPAVAGDGSLEETTVNDNELHWYNNEVRVRAAGTSDVKDSARILRYAAEGQPHQKIPLHGSDDPDGTAVMWMLALNAPGINEKDYDIICKDLAIPIMGGKYNFKFWFRNVYGDESQNNAFKIQGIAYEIDGTAHELKKLDLTSWSGDGINMGVGWYDYSDDLPADKIIHRVAVKIMRNEDNTTAKIGLDDWAVIDGVEFEDTVLRTDVITGLGVTDWKHTRTENDITATNVTSDAFGDEYGKKLLITGGFTHHPDDFKPDQSIYKTFEEPVNGGFLSFKMQCLVNSTVPGQPHFQMFANAYEEDGTKHELGNQPEGTDYLPLSFVGDQMYFGYTRYTAALPDDTDITKIEIGIYLTTTEIGLGADASVFFATDIKLVGALGGDEPGGEDPGGTDPPLEFPEFPARKNFTPDTSPAGKDIYEDSELGWYGEDVYENAGVLVDHVRIIKYEEGFTESDGWPWIKNHFIRHDTDSDVYAMQFMAVVNHPLTEGRPYDLIYKDLSVPIQGGTFDFYFWFRNGYPMNHNVFAIEAFAFDADGNAYGLGVLPDSNDAPGLDWSGDHVNKRAGWYHYSAAMPLDVPIVRLGIKVLKPDLSTTGVLGPVYNGEWFAEEWFAIDEIRVIDTTILGDGYVFDDEEGWESDYSTLTPMGEYLHPTCILEGDTAIEMENYFNFDDYPDYTNLYKEFDKPISGGKFAFSLYNVTNSYLTSQPKFQVDVYGYKDGDTESTRTKLGTYPGEEGYLKYSGSTDSFQMYNGWNGVSVDIPDNAKFIKLEIVIREITGVKSDGSLIFVDDIKLIGVSFGSPEDSKSEDPESTDPKEIPSTDASSPLSMAIVLSFFAVSTMVGLRIRNRRSKVW